MTAGATDRELELSVLWKAVRHSWWIVLLCIFVFGMVGAASALLVRPVYRAEAVLIPANIDEGGGAGASLAGRLGGLAALGGIDLGVASDRSVEALALLGSRTLAEDFIREKQLMPVLFAKKWDQETSKWNVGALDDVPTMWDAYEIFDKEVRHIQQDTKTGIVKLSIDWFDPAQAAEWAADIVKLVNAKMRNRSIHEAETSLVYLRRGLDETTVVAVKQALFRLVELESKKKMLASVNDEFAFRVIDPPVASDPSRPLKPNKLLYIALGGFVGIVFGIGTAVLRFRTIELGTSSSI